MKISSVSEYYSCTTPQEFSLGMGFRHFVSCFITLVYSENFEKLIANRMLTLASHFGNFLSVAVRGNRIRISPLT